MMNDKGGVSGVRDPLGLGVRDPLGLILHMPSFLTERKELEKEVVLGLGIEGGGGEDGSSTAAFGDSSPPFFLALAPNPSMAAWTAAARQATNLARLSSPKSASLLHRRGLAGAA
ncbi:hypothetical protein SESBI_44948, partial [Sesbania bispinosa]